MEIFEFLGCDEHRYSYGCALQCPDKCKDNNCDVINGSCTFGCTDPDALTPDCIGKYIFSALIVNSVNAICTWLKDTPP